MRFCASNTPDLRNGTWLATSNRELRELVVCGTKVASARSTSSAGMLMTSAGRTLAVMPRSTNQISPRFGLTALLAPVQPVEEPINRGNQVRVLREIVRLQCRPAEEFREYGGLFGLGQLVEVSEHLPGRLGHGFRVASCDRGVKYSGDSRSLTIAHHPRPLRVSAGGRRVHALVRPHREVVILSRMLWRQGSTPGSAPRHIP